MEFPVIVICGIFAVTFSSEEQLLFNMNSYHENLQHTFKIGNNVCQHNNHYFEIENDDIGDQTGSRFC